jgi:D-alanine transaminase
MSRWAYVNGRFQPHGEAVVHVEDRGYQFADAVYEVWAVIGGKLADFEGHMTRLGRSLDELRIEHPMTRASLLNVLRETVRRNRVKFGLCYIQVSRGVARRDHPFPDPAVAPSVVITCKPLDRVAMEAKARKGVAVVTQPDIRWGRCDIKTVCLLPNILAKQAARERGAAEAWLVDDMGMVTEGSSTNAWIVDKDGNLRTRDTQANILRGITRGNLLSVATDAGVAVLEQAFTVDEAKQAKEAFFTAASAFLTPVVSIDGAEIGDGKPGPLTTRLRELYFDRAAKLAV